MGRPSLFFLLGGLLVTAFLLHLGIGGTWLGPGEVVSELLRGVSGERSNAVVWDIRMPRTIACVLVGAMLSAVGSSFQALFRNPLADPYVVGVSSGAAVGGVAAIALGWDAWWGGLGTMGLAFVSGLLSLGLVYGLARRRGTVDVATLLLAGVVVGSLLAALTTLILYALGQDTNRVLRWLLGSMTPMFWDRLGVLCIAAVIGISLLFLQTRELNAFAIGEGTARHLGINVGRLKWVVLVAGTGVTAICVGAVGIVGFLGLVAPHIGRRLLGVDWRMSMPAAILIGPMLLLFADVLAQRAIRDMELPVGVVTALLGAPFMLLLLRRDTAQPA
jgi:iron complex transport system permease protein